MSHFRLFILLQFSLTTQLCLAQSDSALQVLQNLQQIPVKFINNIDNKIDKYSSRITGKTEKTLAKLSRWENKIKTILEQVSPETASKLFGNNQITFSTLLQKLKEGKAVAEGYKTKYDEYRDKLTTSIKYLENQKDKLNKNLISPINTAKKKLTELEQDISNIEAVEAFIIERKKQLVNEAVKYIGNSKYLTKINKESYYYVETLRNYKEIFCDKKKAEETALTLLNKIPAFTKFVQQNSLLSSLFRSLNTPVDMSSLAGLQTKVSVQTLIQDRLAAGGPNAQSAFSQNFQQAQAELNKLKDKVIKAGGNSSDANIPSFKPNTQKSKPFFNALNMAATCSLQKITAWCQRL